MKRLFIFLLLCICFIPSTVLAFVEQSNLLYVTDEAGVLSEDSEDYIVRYSDVLARKKGIRYYVVTTSSLENYELDDYANYISKSFKMGENSVLFFFTKDEKMVQVVLGTGLSSVMEEEEIDQYIRQYAMPYFQNGEWDKGIRNGYVAFYKKVCDYYHIDTSDMELSSGNEFSTKYRYPLLMGFVFCGMLFGYVFCSFFRKVLRHAISSFFDFIFFLFAFVLNIGLLTYAYSIEPWILFIILGVELLSVFSTFGSSDMSLEDAFKKVRLEEKKKKQKRTRKSKKKLKK